MTRKLAILSPSLHVPKETEVLDKVWDFYLRMLRQLKPRATKEQLPSKKNALVKDIAARIHNRLERASGLHALKEPDRMAVQRLVRNGGRLHGLMTAHEVDEWAALLHGKTPWMSELTTILMKRMRAQVAIGHLGLSLPPLLIVGKPGNGKSWYAHMLGQLAGVPVREIDVGSGGASFRISGLEKGWANANPGVPVDMMLAEGIANPVIIVNEICKAPVGISSTSGGVTSLTTALLQMLEKETAARFECPVFRLRFDLSRINWILTANDLDRVPAPLRDRCQVFQMPKVTPSVASVMFDTLAAQAHDGIDPDLLAMARTEVISAAASGHVSLRQIGRILEQLAVEQPLTIH